MDISKTSDDTSFRAPIEPVSSKIYDPCEIRDHVGARRREIHDACEIHDLSGKTAFEHTICMSHRNMT